MLGRSLEGFRRERECKRECYVMDDTQSPQQPVYRLMNHAPPNEFTQIINLHLTGVRRSP
jgi:hypothetical protein